MWSAVAPFMLPAVLAQPIVAPPVRIQVLSAVVKDEKIAGATVILQKNGAPSATAPTNAQGEATLHPAFSEYDMGVLLLVKRTGYSTLVAKCPCNGMTYAISPFLQGLDGLRVVLNWSSEPSDLDSHLVYPGSHIFWDSKRGSDANLDVDDTNGYGPETVTVEKKRFGSRYVYAVHDYTHTHWPNVDTLARSEAKVFVYIGQTLIRTYYVPRHLKGNLWVVFALDEHGEFLDINRVEAAAAKGERLDAAAFARYLTGAIPVETIAASGDGTTTARQLNKQGEEAYHAKRLAEAIELYRQALELEPQFGQAYSNLGLAYQKTGQIAEAIWANRKAIALASGPEARVVRASSYYNVARIYEQAGQLEDALQQYELAQEQKPGKVYADAVARMKARIGR